MDLAPFAMELAVALAGLTFFWIVLTFLSLVKLRSKDEVLRRMEKDLRRARSDLKLYIDSYVRWAGDQQDEAMVVGSDFEAARPFPYQLAVYTKAPFTGGELSVGQGFYVDIKQRSWQGPNLVFVTAQHVVDSCLDGITLAGPLGRVSFGVDRMRPVLGMDASYCRLSPSELQKLGCATARVATFTQQTPVSVVSFGKKSVGMLELGEKFGTVVFSGSTIKGFSGAPYAENKRVFGMHTSGCAAKKMNFGLSAAVIAHRIIRQETRTPGTPEDSFEYLEDIIKTTFATNKTLRWAHPNPDMDEVDFIAANGRVYTMDAEEFDDVLKKHAGGKHSYRARGALLEDDEEIYRGKVVKTRHQNDKVRVEATYDVYTQTVACDYEDNVTVGFETYEQCLDSLTELESGIKVRDVSVGGVTVSTQTDYKVTCGVEVGIQKDVDRATVAAQFSPEHRNKLVGTDDEFRAPTPKVQPKVELESADVQRQAEERKPFLGASASESMSFHLPNHVGEDAQLLSDLRQMAALWKESQLTSAMTGQMKTLAPQSEVSVSSLIEQLKEERTLLKAAVTSLQKNQKREVVPPAPKKKSKLARKNEELAELKRQLALLRAEKSNA